MAGLVIFDLDPVITAAGLLPRLAVSPWASGECGPPYPIKAMGPLILGRRPTWAMNIVEMKVENMIRIVNELWLFGTRSPGYILELQTFAGTMMTV